MKKIFTRIGVLAMCALALCFALTACAGGGNNGAKMAGYWELESGTSGSEEITAEDVAFMKTLGVQFIIYLGEDGSAIVDTFGDVEDVTWDIKSASIIYGDSTGDSTGKLELNGDKLCYSEGSDGKLYFTKGDDTLKQKIEEDRKAMEEGSSTTVKTESEAINPPVTVTDDEILTITAIERVVDENGMAGIKFAFTNHNSEGTINFHTVDDATISGKTYECYFYATVPAGATVEEVCAFDGLSKLEELKDIHLQFSAYDSMTFNDIATCNVDIA